MRCHDIRARLSAYALKEIDQLAARRIAQHLDSCRTCADEYAEIMASVGRIAQHGAPPSPSPPFLQNVHDTVHAAITAERRTRVFHSRLWKYAAIAPPLATVVALSLLIIHPKTPVIPALFSFQNTQELWQYDQAAAMTSTQSHVPALSDRFVFALRNNREGAIVALGIDNGKKQWITPLHAYGYLHADGERVYALCPDPGNGVRLVALDAVDGRVLWQYRPGVDAHIRTFSAPTSADAMLAWSVGPTMHLIDSRTGARLWSRTVSDDGLCSTPLFMDNALFVASDNGLFRYDQRTGEPVWRRAFQHRVAGNVSPRIAGSDGAVFVAHRSVYGNGSVSCFTADQGRLRWQRNNIGVFTMAAGDGRVYTRSFVINALDGGSGKTLWSLRTSGCSPVSFANGIVCFMDAGTRTALVSLDAATGKKYASRTLDNACAGIVIRNHVGVVVSNTGVLHALRADRIVHSSATDRG